MNNSEQNLSENSECEKNPSSNNSKIDWKNNLNRFIQDTVRDGTSNKYLSPILNETTPPNFVVQLPPLVSESIPNTTPKQNEEDKIIISQVDDKSYRMEAILKIRDSMIKSSSDTKNQP